MLSPIAASIPASRSYFFQSAFAGQQAAMCTTLRAESIGRNWAHGVGQAAAGEINSGHSVKCRDSLMAQAPLVINRQPRLDAIDMSIAGPLKRASRQIGRLVAQGHVYIDLLVHGGIVGCLKRKFHSYFPVVDFVHGQIVGRATQQRNAEINGGSAA